MKQVEQAAEPQTDRIVHSHYNANLQKPKTPGFRPSVGCAPAFAAFATGRAHTTVPGSRAHSAQ